VGKRMSLPYTRAMVDAAVEGRLENVPMKPHPPVIRSRMHVPVEEPPVRLVFACRRVHGTSAGVSTAATLR
jgi:ATP-dependent phosphoenolpyruvate carboxykinase